MSSPDESPKVNAPPCGLACAFGQRHLDCPVDSHLCPVLAERLKAQLTEKAGLGGTAEKPGKRQPKMDER